MSAGTELDTLESHLADTVETALGDEEVNECLALSAKDFAALKAAERDVVLFVLLKSVAGTMRSFAFDVEQGKEWMAENLTEEKIREKVMGVAGGFLGGF